MVNSETMAEHQILSVQYSLVQYVIEVSEGPIQCSASLEYILSVNQVVIHYKLRNPLEYVLSVNQVVIHYKLRNRQRIYLLDGGPNDKK